MPRDGIRVRWEHVCNICKNPLNVYIETDRKLTLCKIVLYSAYKDLNLSMNKKYYKTRGANAKCVLMCLTCVNRLNETKQNLQKRELGIKYKRHIKKSWTQQEIYDWFTSACRFIYDENCNWEEFLDHEPKIQNVRVFHKSIEWTVND